MAGTDLRIVRVADDLAALEGTLARVLQAVRLRLVADGELCADDEAVLEALDGVQALTVRTHAVSEEDAAHVIYGLSLFRANPASRRSMDRRRHVEELYGELPALPGDDTDPEPPATPLAVAA